MVIRRSARAVVLGAVAVMLVPGGAAQARTARDAVIDDNRTMCERYGGGTLRVEPGLETSAELNGDSRPDTLIDLTKIKCDGVPQFRPTACSEYGCSLLVYLSSPRVAWSQAFSGNDIDGPIYRWELLPAGNRRSQLRLEMGGAVCRPVKASACAQTFSWDYQSGKTQRGPLTAIKAPTAAAATTAEAAASAGAPGTLDLPQFNGSANNRAAKWLMNQTSEGFSIARVEIGGAVQRMIMYCNAGKPELHAAFQPSPAQGPLPLAFTTGGDSATVLLEANPATGQWKSQVVSPDVIRLLTGPAKDMYMTMGGQVLGPLSLSGAAGAIRTSMASCLAPPAGAVATARPVSAAGAGFSIEIRLTPRAAKAVAAARQRVIAIASYNATAKPSTPERLMDEVTGDLMLGEEEVVLGPQGGIAQFPLRNYARQYLQYAESPPIVQITVVSSREGENKLDCGYFGRQLSELAETNIISCDIFQFM